MVVACVNLARVGEYTIPQRKKEPIQLACLPFPFRYASRDAEVANNHVIEVSASALCRDSQHSLGCPPSPHLSLFGTCPLGQFIVTASTIPLSTSDKISLGTSHARLCAPRLHRCHTLPPRRRENRRAAVPGRSARRELLPGYVEGVGSSCQRLPWRDREGRCKASRRERA